MDIQLKPDLLNRVNDTNGNKKPEEVALAFEKIFARQLVQEMTKGLFENDDNNTMMTGGAGLYRKYIVDTLSTELAKQGNLGMGDMVLRYIDQKNG